jgi:hypothetical protein
MKMDAIYMSQRDQYLICPAKIKITAEFNRDLANKF